MPLARCPIPAIVSAMFDLTRREQALLAGVIAVFLLGLGTMHWRSVSAPQPPAPAMPVD